MPNATSHHLLSYRRWIAPVALLLAVLGVFLSGLHRVLTLEAFAAHNDAITGMVRDHLLLSLTVYAGLYVMAVALSLPGAAVLSIAGGYLFGWAVSAPVTVAAATLGAVIVFQIVKTSLGTTLAERAGPWVQRLSSGFARDAFFYLLFLRLVPAFPFFAVNAVAGLARVQLRTFALATFIGIIPGSLAFAWLGTGFGSVIEGQKRVHADCVAAKGPEACSFELEPSHLITRELLIAFGILGAVALIPVVLRRCFKAG